MNDNRYSRPATTIPDRIDVPQAQCGKASCGARIYAIQAPEYGVVRVSFVFAAGSSWQTVPFCASATVNNLAEGSSRLTSQEIADRLDYYGSYYDVSMDRDWSVVSFVCLSKFFDNTMELAREILLDPLFPEGELRTYCDKSRQSLAINRMKVDFRARELFMKSLYGASHPYGISSPAELYDSLTAADLREFHRRRYTSAGCFAVISGDASDSHCAAVASILDGMPEGQSGDNRSFPKPAGVSHAGMPFPNAVQSAIRVGRILFPRTHPDYIGMQVVAMVLGGYFGSRLIRNLREEHGYTYGAYSAMVNLDRSGYFAAATEVGAQFTADAERQILHEIERLRTETVPEEELALVRNIMAGEVMRILDGPFGIADVTIENIQNGFDNSYTSDFIGQVRSITPMQIRRLAAQYLTPESLCTVVVGPQAL